MNHRFAPDRSPAEAEQHVRDVLAPSLADDDEVDVINVAAGAAPGLTHPLLRTLIEHNGLEVRAKLGWTDVSFFADLGIPAANFGPGDSELAHTARECVDREQIEQVRRATVGLLTDGV